MLSLLKRKFPSENFLYYGDNDNAPYGSKSERQLLFITMKNLDYILSFGIKAIVVACNTLSAAVLSDIRYYSGKKTFGVFPPVHKCIMRNEKTLLLSTPLTAEKYITTPGLYILSLPDLASEIEANAFNLRNIDLTEVLSRGYLYVPEDEFLSGNYKKRSASTIFDHRKIPFNFRVSEYKFAFDAIICGCTHYSLIKKQIFDHLGPAKIICGEDYTIDLMNQCREIIKTSGNYCENEILFVGKNARFNERIYREVVSAAENMVKKFEK